MFALKICLPLFDLIDASPMETLLCDRWIIGGAMIDILRPLYWRGLGGACKLSNWCELLLNMAWFIGRSEFKFYLGLRAMSAEVPCWTTSCTMIPPSCSILSKSFLRWLSFSTKSSLSPQPTKLSSNTALSLGISAKPCLRFCGPKSDFSQLTGILRKSL